VTTTRALFALACMTATAWAEPVQVVVVKRAGVMAYEEVAEEFAEMCRVRARVITLADESARPPHFSADDLVVTVGQEALDSVRGTKARVIPTLAFETPDGLIGPPTSPHPELILRVLAMARGGRTHTIGVVFGPRSTAVVGQAARAAERLGLAMRTVRVASGPEAVRALHAMSNKVDALWLPGDTDVITIQVFQYALRLQLERGLPVAAATRQQVHSGAFVAADFDPHAAGRIAADLANRYLEGRSVVTDPSELDMYSGARLTVNAQVARRLGVDGEALLRMGARFE
jgi:hypothetical protein